MTTDTDTFQTQRPIPLVTLYIVTLLCIGHFVVGLSQISILFSLLFMLLEYNV